MSFLLALQGIDIVIQMLLVTFIASSSPDIVDVLFLDIQEFSSTKQ